MEVISFLDSFETGISEAVKSWSTLSSLPTGIIAFLLWFSEWGIWSGKTEVTPGSDSYLSASSIILPRLSLLGLLSVVSPCIYPGSTWELRCSYNLSGAQVSPQLKHFTPVAWTLTGWYFPSIWT